MSSTAISFEKLTESNYQRWSVQMKSTLQRDGVWRIVSGEEVEPSPPADSDADSTKRVIEIEIRNYWMRYDRATGTIRLGISEDLLLEYMSIDDPTVILETIRTKYKDLVKERGRNIRGQLARISLKQYGTVRAYFLQIDGLCADLAVIQGSLVSEEEKITAAMHEIPEEWNPVKTVIRSNVDYTYTDMKRQLKEYEADLQKTLAMPADAALLVNGAPAKQPLFLTQRRVSVSRNGREGYRNGERSNRKEDRREFKDVDMVCFNCDRKGHRRADCRRFGGGAYLEDRSSQNTRNRQVESSTWQETGNTAVTNHSGGTAWLGCEVVPKSALAEDHSSRGGTSCFIDTGCSRHMTWDKSLFIEYRALKKGECQVEVADNHLVEAEGVGKITFTLLVFGVVVPATVQDVLHVPSLGKTLISHAELGKAGIHVEHVKDCGFYLREFGPQGRIVGLAPEVDHLYPLLLANADITSPASKRPDFPTNYLASVSTSLLLWHQRLAHLGPAATNALTKWCTGMPARLTSQCDCIDCLYGKQVRKPFTLLPIMSRSSQPLELIQSDLPGRIPAGSLAGSRYYIIFIDDFTRFTMIYFLKKKSEAFQAFQDYETVVVKYWTVRAADPGDTTPESLP